MSYIDKDATLAAIANKAKEELADANHYFLEGVQLAVDVVEGMTEPKEVENGSMSCPDARKSHDRTTDDCISRQATIDAIKKCRNESDMPDMWYDGMSCALRCIYQLPSAQPKSYREGYQAGFKDGQISSSCSHEKDAEQIEPDEPFEKCSSCIHDDDGVDICVLRQCKHAIGELKECYEPKQPDRRRGKWVLQKDRRKTLYGWYHCSECGAFICGKTNYCSECGADMREVDDGSD